LKNGSKIPKISLASLRLAQLIDEFWVSKPPMPTTWHAAYVPSLKQRRVYVTIITAALRACYIL